MKIKLPFFDEIDSDSLTDYYQVDAEIEGKQIELDLNFDDTKIDTDSLISLKNYLDTLPGVIEIAKKEILNDYETDENVKEYLTYHIEELDQNELDSLTENADKSTSLEKQMLSVLHLRRIGFYPENEDQYAVFDFVLDLEISQYILVVNMNSAKALDHITMES
jgi:hypothetical protein